MPETNQNPYKTPDAELIKTANNMDILKLGRFSAWGVFGLTLITLGFYPLYWMFTRAGIINTLHEKKISSALLITLALVTILSFVAGFFDETTAEILAGGVIGIIYLVVYLVVLFKIRNRLQDIMLQSLGDGYGVGPVLTFFGFTIYLQYKINQAIDAVSDNTLEGVTAG